MSLRMPNRLLALTLAAVTFTGMAHAADKTTDKAAANKPIAKVNGATIPLARAELLFLQQRSQGAQDTPELRNEIKNILVTREVLAQAAVKQGLEKLPLLQAQMDLARQSVLIGAYQQEFMQSHPVKDEDLKREYDVIKTRLGDKEYKTRHILVSSEEAAKEIITKLQNGEKFDKLAAESKDTGSKDNGGDLGWSTPTSYVKPFADALVRLEKGKFSAQPVQTQFGWHVIQLDDVRELKAPSFDEVKGQLQQGLAQRAFEQHVAELRAKAKVE